MILHHPLTRTIEEYSLRILGMEMTHVEIGFYFIKIRFHPVDQVDSNDQSDGIFPMIFFVLVYAVACASLSIIASSLSVILLWLAGGYLYVRRQRLAPNFVTIIAALTLLICKSLELMVKLGG